MDHGAHFLLNHETEGVAHRISRCLETLESGLLLQFGLPSSLLQVGLEESDDEAGILLSCLAVILHITVFQLAFESLSAHTIFVDVLVCLLLIHHGESLVGEPVDKPANGLARVLIGHCASRKLLHGLHSHNLHLSQLDFLEIVLELESLRDQIVKVFLANLTIGVFFEHLVLIGEHSNFRGHLIDSLLVRAIQFNELSIDQVDLVWRHLHLGVSISFTNITNQGLVSVLEALVLFHIFLKIGNGDFLLGHLDLEESSIIHGLRRVDHYIHEGWHGLAQSLP